MVPNTSKALTLDLEKSKAEEVPDGCYAIVTSKYEEKDDRTIEMDRGIWNNPKDSSCKIAYYS